MAKPTVVCPKGHTSDAHRVRRDGWATTKDGRRQYLRCISAEGEAHRFYGEEADPVAIDGRRTSYDVRCPQPGHKDAVIQSRGVRTTKSGSWRRFACTRPNGSSHTFRVMLSEGAPTAPAPTTPPPPCPEHPDSKVTRAGTYGGLRPRQRYRCRPPEGKAHQFTPPLSREAVTAGKACTRCDELLSPHSGPLTAARHTPWPLVGIVQALNDLSLGESYGNVSLALRARRDAVRHHLAHEHGVAVFGTGAAPASATTDSYTARERRNAWRVAADLVEQYSPPLFDEVHNRYQGEAAATRQANDTALAQTPGASLQRPLVYVLDELPVWTKSGQGRAKRPTWNVLVVVEVLYEAGSDPMALPARGTRLRLARALPRTNADAWRLVLDELGVRPDFVVADNGTGLQAALSSYYADTVGVVPSLWHINQNLHGALVKLDNATFSDGGEKVLVDPLRKHLARLTREDLIGRTPLDITGWWDELEALVVGLPAPVSNVKNLRRIHEPRLLEALPILTANPHVPASNAAVENRIRMSLKPFLETRAHLFGNAERTNRLLNLLVCRQAGVFTDLDDLASRIRAMNEATGGWAPAPRQILDKQPPTVTNRNRRYASLKSHSVITKLAKDKNITTAAEAAAAAPIPVMSKQRAQTSALLPIREWARNLGLPAGVTGPIRGSVTAAYQAAQDGASDDQARAVYVKGEKDRLKKIAEARDAKWTAAAERARKAELAPIRAWAEKENLELPKNNSIPAEVRAAYEAAQRGETLTSRPSKQPKKVKT